MTDKPRTWRMRVTSVDPADRLPMNRLIPLVLVETAGVSLLFIAYRVLDLNHSALAPLIVPPLVSFVLVFATAHARGSRPLRVLVAYLIAATVGLGIATLTMHPIGAAAVSAMITLFLMHWWGAFHAPAVALAMAAVLSLSEWTDIFTAWPLVMGTVVVVLALAWFAHRILGDDTYPDRWW